ncbi:MULTISPECIES: arginase [unclassified Methylobacterium]|uniref:arginase n=1 Tax=unclassified Methylobacterium TaxID=2615210 RepID=UPI0006FF0DE4|nr:MULTISPECIES: arginase [unclassified Methylobacterium]KQP80668.1 arginase [Methylobacterium sp. Leaf117]KQP93753.1 arginase [Methylobacterium sp. Leaf113]MCK2056970.1 arginase [Methylobacterium sp. 37f]
MTNRRCILLGARVQEGAGRLGCDMGPSAYRAAGLAETLSGLGLDIVDAGDLAPAAIVARDHPNRALRHLGAFAAWTEVLAAAAYAHSADALPIFLGGDHSLSAGTLSGLGRRAAQEGRPLFVLWLDAHADFHTLDTTTSGNLHGVPLAYATGRRGFAAFLPAPPAPIDPRNVCLMGTRSLDPAERVAVLEAGVLIHDMRSIDEAGVVAPLRAFLGRVAAAGGRLHVSLDVDFLDPGIAPGVGTTVPGGATFREAHLIMEMLHDSRLVGSLDLVELNPFLDERGRTAHLMVDLAASLMGRTVLDRPTQSY